MSALTTTVFAAAKLLVTIVNRGQGEHAMAVAKEAGAGGGTLLLGRGTADSRWLRLLGLDDVCRDVLLTLVEPEQADSVMDALRRARSLRRSHGVVFRMDVSGMLRHVPLTAAAAGTEGAVSAPSFLLPSDFPSLTGRCADAGSPVMSQNATHELISVIVNAGYADDVMAAARKAGAPGGTVINARGTGREEDVRFFGITIVPEKELILILTPKAAKQAVLGAIRAVPCLDRPGTGIAFCMEVEDFSLLGGDAAQRSE